MSDISNIPTGLNIPTQIPLDPKTTSPNELTLSNLGLNNNLAFTYYDGLIIRCIEEDTYYKWKEVPIGLENTGLIFDDFIYPDNYIVFNIDYSLKSYNFFKEEFLTLNTLPILTSPNGSIQIVNVSPSSITLQVNPSAINGSQTKINAGQNITITGNGTISTPYVITSNYYIQAGTNITITGAGIQSNPLIINSVNQDNWLTGDVKSVICTIEYITLNFDSTGLGKNERLGWAIINGNNGTLVNDDGRVEIGYGTGYSIPQAQGGSKDAVLVKHRHGLSQLIAHTNNNGALGFFDQALGGPNAGFTTDETGVDGTNKNLPPYVVRLKIMKL